MIIQGALSFVLRRHPTQSNDHVSNFASRIRFNRSWAIGRVYSHRATADFLVGDSRDDVVDRFTVIDVESLATGDLHAA